MKKYIKPMSAVVDVEIESLLTDASIGSDGKGGVNGRTPGGKPSENPETGAAAKFDYVGTIWDDVSEEEE